MDKSQPIYLFADSQPLFWKSNGSLFLQNIRERLTGSSPKAAYIGASNGDNPEYYEIFLAAMESIGINDCCMISAFFEEEEQEFLDNADIILLAGGDVELGWKTFQAVGLDKKVQQQYSEGAILIGVSAGAVQLGLCGCTDDSTHKDNVFNTFQIIPLAIGAHEEKNEWQNLKRLIKAKETFGKGIGIPTGGGMIYHADHSIEPIRYPLQELIYKKEEKEVTANLLYPGTEDSETVNELG